jgi:hypothetical protein
MHSASNSMLLKRLISQGAEGLLGLHQVVMEADLEILTMRGKFWKVNSEKYNQRNIEKTGEWISPPPVFLLIIACDRIISI